MISSSLIQIVKELKLNFSLLNNEIVAFEKL